MNALEKSIFSKLLGEVAVGGGNEALAEDIHDLVSATESKLAQELANRTLRPLSEWHEDYYDVLWWRVPVEEPPVYVGCPLDSDWAEFIEDMDGAEIMWSRIPEPIECAQAAKKEG
jgi:hypothetical protein